MVVDAQKDQSPERNLYHANNGLVDKVPVHGKLFSATTPATPLTQSAPVSAYHQRRRFDDEDDEDEENDADMDVVKARFLFGDAGVDAGNGRYLPAKRQNDAEVVVHRTPPANMTGLSYKYSTLLKDASASASPAAPGAGLTTKILISNNHNNNNYSRQQQPKASPGDSELLFRYSDDEELDNGVAPGGTSVGGGLSRGNGVQHKGSQANLMSLHLIQEAQRGRPAVRRADANIQTSTPPPEEMEPSQQTPPKAPMRTKKTRTPDASPRGRQVQSVQPQSAPRNTYFVWFFFVLRHLLLNHSTISYSIFSYLFIDERILVITLNLMSVAN